MRTTLDLPADLLEQARRAANLATKRETVVAGLEELIRKAHRAELLTRDRDFLDMAQVVPLHVSRF